jgi:cytochrome c biogenesis protein CcmG/thiol:disulfide interchange protein DsbE
MAPAVALALVLSLALAACGVPPTDRTAPPGDGPLLPRDRLALPEYGVEEYRAMVEELRGKPVVVNFWGSWCPPCRLEAPHLDAVSREFEGRVQFVGVNFRDARASARDFILEFDWRFPSVFDPDYEILPALGYLGWPVTLIYDRAGNVTLERVGAVDRQMLRTEIRKVL